MKNRTPMVKLTDEEVAAIRALRDEKTKHGAAAAIGVGATVVVNAIAGEPVHRLSAIYIRRYFGGSGQGSI